MGVAGAGVRSRPIAALALVAASLAGCSFGSEPAADPEPPAADRLPPAAIPRPQRLVAVGSPTSLGVMSVATFAPSGRFLGWNRPPKPIFRDVVALSPDGTRIAARRNDSKRRRGVIEVYSVADWTMRVVLQTRLHVVDVDWLPDGSRLAAILGSGDDRSRLAYRHRLVIIDPERGSWQKFPLPDFSSLGAFSSDGKRVLITRWTIRGEALGEAIEVLDLATGRRTEVISFEQLHVSGVAWSPDGRRIAYATHSDGVQLIALDLTNHGPLLPPGYNSDDGMEVTQGSFSPDGRFLAASWFPDCSADEWCRGRLVVFDLARDASTAKVLRAPGEGSVEGPFAWVAS